MIIYAVTYYLNVTNTSIKYNNDHYVKLLRKENTLDITDHWHYLPYFMEAKLWFENRDESTTQSARIKMV
jgi:hypothetical protein